ncbi:MULTISPECIES: endolytic transglycosylase MltG [Bacillus]|uniref:Endolytic murein transglycosylase n=1 Tax=Bacillus capparidis TaxID=1840411 RepID=A0ABS4CTP1_9BACI|nr:MULTISPECIES: endolytic transglycosylase MltG [Bacillus]MBP1080896.1 UPF0755 protein [Bacillus capparidis]MED1097535.1 endolytic transglycosylase MltG [Bacillus capparidis]
MPTKFSNKSFEKKLQEKRIQAKKVRKIVFSIIAAIVVVIAVSAGGAYFYIKSALEPTDSTNNESIHINIPSGSSVSDIAGILESNELIKDSRIFRYYVRFENVSGFQAGDFNLKKSMGTSEIIEKLTKGENEVAFQLIVPEGRKIDQIADTIAENTSYSSEEVMKTLDDRKFINELKEKYPETITDEIFNKNIKHPLEGYLYPATYPFYNPQTSLKEIVIRMVEETDKQVKKYKSTMDERNMSVHKTLTMASLIEEEATAKVDRHKISSVFHNRLKKDMPLQTDPTVLYALGEHKDRVVYKDLEVNSPFNTYKNKGLTPGPIANAGTTSWEAALNPENTEFVYFLAKKDGEVVFTKTLEEHNAAKEKFIINPEGE